MLYGTLTACNGSADSTVMASVHAGPIDSYGYTSLIVSVSMQMCSQYAAIIN